MIITNHKIRKMNTNRKRIYMWYKVKELLKEGFNKSQISKETGLDRATVRKYINMSEESFHQWISTPRNMPLKLFPYLKFVKNRLQETPYLSAAQIEDYLKEHFTDLPDIHSKTIYNFVQTIRKKYDIPKPKKKDNRTFEMLPETAFGHQAQVDFGETWMQTINKTRKKVYFFAIVLSRSRYKFIYFENKAFTASSAITAHELAFEYFMGVPKEIIYDQDSVFIYDENLGDYQLTQKFKTYCSTQDFKVVFCRKADPQSKGKVENVVKYVKQNYLRGRKYVDIETLNQDAKAWLKRTANAKKHSATHKIPVEQWSEEKKHLLAFKSKNKNKQLHLTSYKVRKDNTIAYKSNFYSLPLGTYKNKESSVLLKEKDEQLFLYSADKKLITTHNISINKGELVRQTDHGREKSKTIETYQKQALEIFGNTEVAQMFLNMLKKDKPRYYRDNLQFILNHVKNYQQETLQKGLLFCIDNKLFNALTLKQVIDKNILNNKQRKEAETYVSSMECNVEFSEHETNLETEKSDIDIYENIICSWKN